MKKMVRNMFAAVAAVALITSFASCADSDAEDPFATSSSSSKSGAGGGGTKTPGTDSGNWVNGSGLPTGYKAKTISFSVNYASTNAEDTVLLVKYDRSAAGAAELIKLSDADITVKKNGTVIKTFDTVEFALDEYGASFSNAATPIADENDMKEYKVKLSIGQTVAVGDTIEVSFTKCKVNAIGSAASSISPTAIQVALIDKNQNAGGVANSYYKELSGTEYQEIFEEISSGNGGNTTPSTGGNTNPVAGGDGNGGQQGGQTPADIGILDAAGDLAWGTPVVASASKFASVEGNKKLTVTYTSNSDNDYHKFKMMAGDGNVNELYAGIATNFTIDLTSTNADNLHGCDFSVAPSATAATFSYQPSVGEWTKIKQNGFKLIGYGAKITKVVVEDSSVANPTDTGSGSTPAAARTVSGSEATLTVANDAPVSSVNTESPVNVVLQYTRANKDENAIKVEPAVLKIFKGSELVKTVTTIEGFSLNLWGGPGNSFDGAAQAGQQMEADNCKCFQLKIPVETVTSIVAGDTIKVLLESGTVVGTGSSLADNLRASIVVGDNSLNGWQFTNICSSDSSN